jgi:hypothetical protein
MHLFTMSVILFALQYLYALWKRKHTVLDSMALMVALEAIIRQSPALSPCWACHLFESFLMPSLEIGICWYLGVVSNGFN